MRDSFDREIDYLRISVTDKCNLRCTYCMPPQGVRRRSHEEFLSFETVAEVCRVATTLGIRKVRLTGGEPLVRRGILELVRLIRARAPLEELAMTTNGVLLAAQAAPLREAGLSRVNVSLDTLEAERYRRITRGGCIQAPLAGIEAALAVGLPVKLNMVVLEDTAAEEIEAMRQFCLRRGVRLQLINHFLLTERKDKPYRFDRPRPCAECNRIRLLADGALKPCLHSNSEIRLDPQDIAGSLRRTILAKPARGAACTNRPMVEIGG